MWALITIYYHLNFLLLFITFYYYLLPFKSRILACHEPKYGNISLQVFRGSKKAGADFSPRHIIVTYTNIKKSHKSVYLQPEIPQNYRLIYPNTLGISTIYNFILNHPCSEFFEHFIMISLELSHSPHDTSTCDL